MNKECLLAGGLLLFLLSSASAEIYRCRTSDGRLIMTDNRANLPADCVPIDQPAVIWPEDAEVGPVFLELRRAMISPFRGAFGNVGCCPQVDTAQVPNQLADIPSGTERDRPVEARPARHLREELPLRFDGCDVLRDLHYLLPIVWTEAVRLLAIPLLIYSLPTTWASTSDIWSCGLNSTILTASSTTTV